MNPPRQVRFGDESVVNAVGIGTIHLVSAVGKNKFNIRLSDVLLIPSFSLSLISVNKLTCAGLSALFEGRSCQIKRKRELIVITNHKKGLYHLDVKPVTYPDQANLAIDINVLHCQMGHISMDRLKRMVSKHQLKDIDTLTGIPEFCEPCVLGNMKKIPFKTNQWQDATRPLQIIHSDIGGPVTPASRNGYRYWITFIDDKSRHPWVYFLKRKSEAQKIYNQWKSDVQEYFDEEIEDIFFSRNFVNFLRMDGGGEYCGNKFEAQLRKEGTIHETTAADTPESNGLAEQMNQTMCNKTVAMLIESGLPKSFWAEAMATATYLIARSPAAGLKGKTPYETLFKRRVDPTFFHPFGCPTYALVPKDKRVGKFGSKARKCVMLGYAPGKKAYRLLDTDTRKIFSSRHVKFDGERQHSARNCPVGRSSHRTHRRPVGGHLALRIPPYTTYSPHSK